MFKLKLEKSHWSEVTSIKFLILSANILLSALLSCSTFAEGNGAPFSVTGEQLEFQPPPGWKLAWMQGSATGSYLVEYIPEQENINTWREGYLAIERYEYPSSEIMNQLRMNKVKVAEMGLIQYINNAKKSCGANHTSMAQRTNTFNGLYFAVGGGYCNQYDALAPFGEGAIVAFAEGKQFAFRIQYGWRPKSVIEQNANPPWRITLEQAKVYIDSIKSMSLCGGDGQPDCNISYIQ